MDKFEDQIIPFKIRFLANLFNIDSNLAIAIAEIESSVGKNQLSSTGAKGVFQLTTIAMQDLLNEMVKHDDDLIDICCGLLFLRLLLKRWKTTEEAIKHYCDPKDCSFYVPKVFEIMKRYEKQDIKEI